MDKCAQNRNKLGFSSGFGPFRDSFRFPFKSIQWNNSNIPFTYSSICRWRSSARRETNSTLSECILRSILAIFSFNFVALFIIIHGRANSAHKIMREKLTFGWRCLSFEALHIAIWDLCRFFYSRSASFCARHRSMRFVHHFRDSIFFVYERWALNAFQNVKLAHKRSKGYLERIGIRSALHFPYSVRQRMDWIHSALSADFPGVTKN